MRFFRDYLVPRIIQYIVVIFCGITAVFIPRLTGQNPVLEMIAQIQSQGSTWIHSGRKPYGNT